MLTVDSLTEVISQQRPSHTFYLMYTHVLCIFLIEPSLYSIPSPRRPPDLRHGDIWFCPMVSYTVPLGPKDMVVETGVPLEV